MGEGGPSPFAVSKLLVFQDSGVPREDLFLTTKLWPVDFGSTSTAEAFKQSCRRLDTDYVGTWTLFTFCLMASSRHDALAKLLQLTQNRLKVDLSLHDLFAHRV